MSKKIESEIHTETIRLYKSGLSVSGVNGIAYRLSISRISVYRILWKYGVLTRQERVGRYNHPSKLSNKTEKEIIHLYKTGTPILEISKKCNCQWRSIYAVLQRNHIKPNRYKGSRLTHIIKGGYKCLYAPDHHRATKDGYVLEHILLAENALGRSLKECEQVHHMTRDRLDNKNILVCTKSYHRFLHTRMDKKTIEWAAQNGCPYPWVF